MEQSNPLWVSQMVLHAAKRALKRFWHHVRVAITVLSALATVLAFYYTFLRPVSTPQRATLPHPSPTSAPIRPSSPFSTGSIPGSMPSPSQSVDTPLLMPPGGELDSVTGITITCGTKGAIVHYTIDGSSPTQASSKYDQPFWVRPGTVLKARAYQGGWRPSGIAEASYIARKPRAVSWQDVLTARHHAEVALTRATSLLPDHPPGSVLAAAQQMWDSGTQYFRQAHLDPAVTSYRECVQLCYQIEMLAHARQSALGLKPTADEADRAAGAALLLLSKLPADRDTLRSIEALCRDGRSLFDSGRYAEACESWKRAINLYAHAVALKTFVTNNGLALDDISLVRHLGIYMRQEPLSPAICGSALFFDDLPTAGDALSSGTIASPSLLPSEYKVSHFRLANNASYCALNMYREVYWRQDRQQARWYSRAGEIRSALKSALDPEQA